MQGASRVYTTTSHNYLKISAEIPLRLGVDYKKDIYDGEGYQWEQSSD